MSSSSSLFVSFLARFRRFSLLFSIAITCLPRGTRALGFEYGFGALFATVTSCQTAYASGPLGFSLLGQVHVKLSCVVGCLFGVVQHHQLSKHCRQHWWRRLLLAACREGGEKTATNWSFVFYDKVLPSFSITILNFWPRSASSDFHLRRD